MTRWLSRLSKCVRSMTRRPLSLPRSRLNRSPDIPGVSATKTDPMMAAGATPFAAFFRKGKCFSREVRTFEAESWEPNLDKAFDLKRGESLARHTEVYLVADSPTAWCGWIRCIVPEPPAAKSSSLWRALRQRLITCSWQNAINSRSCHGAGAGWRDRGAVKVSAAAHL